MCTLHHLRGGKYVEVDEDDVDFHYRFEGGDLDSRTGMVTGCIVRFDLREEQEMVLSFEGSDLEFWCECIRDLLDDCHHPASNSFVVESVECRWADGCRPFGMRAALEMFGAREDPSREATSTSNYIYAEGVYLNNLELRACFERGFGRIATLGGSLRISVCFRFQIDPVCCCDDSGYDSDEEE